ncbi:dihydrofolate reductase [Candidatus Woesearchaeota archaeon]|nr:dihydrofolate reductase [Candidatus Woesearchaeota archaeon]
MSIIIIAAMTKKGRVIGKDNTLPWDIPEEMEKFRAFTRGQVVIMGRKTWDSLPAGRKPLPNKVNIVISATMKPASGVHVFPTLKEGIEKAKEFGKDIYIIGGHGIFKEGVRHADRMYLSFVKHDYDGDTFFPEFDESEWNIEKKEDHKEFEFVVYARKRQ